MKTGLRLDSTIKTAWHHLLIQSARRSELVLVTCPVASSTNRRSSTLSPNAYIASSTSVRNITATTLRHTLRASPENKS